MRFCLIILQYLSQIAELLRIQKLLENEDKYDQISAAQLSYASKESINKLKRMKFNI